MKEEDIKSIWNSGGEGQKTNYPKEAIDAIISQGPNNVVQRFVKTLRIEQTLNTVSMLLVAAYMLVVNKWETSLAFIAFNALAFFYYRRLIIRLNIETIDRNVIEYLRETQRLICQFIRHYRIFIFVLLFPAFWLAMKITERIWDIAEIWQHTLSYLINAGVVSVLLVASLLTLHWMYVKKSAKLQEMIDSLSAEE